MVEKEQESKNFFNLHVLVAITIFLLLLLASYKLGEKTCACKGPHPWMGDLSNKQKQIPDRIQRSDIVATKEKVVILGDYSLAEYKNTDSMLPLLDYGSTGIQLKVFENTELYVGDVVSYRIGEKEELVVHRITGGGVDDEGVYYVLKGDNVGRPDTEKVRKEQIEKVLVGVLW